MTVSGRVTPLTYSTFSWSAQTEPVEKILDRPLAYSTFSWSLFRTLLGESAL
jgi:hypothetical protein